MKNQHLLKDGRYGTLCDQIRTGEATYYNLVGGDNYYEKLSKDTVFSHTMIDIIAENGHKYLNSKDNNLAFEYMMYASAAIIKENPHKANNITPLLHKIKDTPPKTEPGIYGMEALAETLIDVVQNRALEFEKEARESSAQNAILIMENLSQIKNMPRAESFINLANKITQNPGFSRVGREAMDKVYLNFRKNNPNFNYDYLDKTPSEEDKTYMDYYIYRKKEQIKQRLQNKENKLSDVVATDKIAEARINGIIDEPITPEKGNKLSAFILKKMLENKQQKK